MSQQLNRLQLVKQLIEAALTGLADDHPSRDHLEMAKTKLDDVIEDFEDIDNNDLASIRSWQRRKEKED